MSGSRAKERILNEKQRLEKKKMLLEMKKEIDSLENNLKNSGITNVKSRVKRTISISGRALQLVAPYVLTAGIIAGGFSTLKATPFYRGDEWKRTARVMTEIDSEGNFREERQYEDFNGDSSKLYYYTKWQKESNDLYSRTIESYNIKRKTFNDISNTIKRVRQENLTVEDILGEPNLITKETKNNLTEEELQEGSYIRAVLYSKDESDYIIHVETGKENLILTILYILVTLACEFIPLKYRSDVSSFDFGQCIYRIREKYPLLDLDEIEKKLEIVQSNYDRLTR